MPRLRSRQGAGPHTQQKEVESYLASDLHTHKYLRIRIFKKY